MARVGVLLLMRTHACVPRLQVSLPLVPASSNTSSSPVLDTGSGGGCNCAAPAWAW